MDNLVAWLERHQVPLYLGALLVGGVVGSTVAVVPGAADGLGAAVNPVLALLLYATFLGIPLRGALATLRDGGFLVTVAVVNFVLVPPVVWLVTRLVADDRALLVGALFVLLAPCVDYVIVFTGLAGGAADRLLAAAPLLMLVQTALLPVFLWLFLGSGTVAGIDPAPFVEAFIVLILLPLCAAALTQAVPGRAGHRVRSVVGGAMVPLMMLTLAVVVASQFAEPHRAWSSVVRVVPVYVLFAVVMTAVGWTTARVAGRFAGTDVPAQRAVVFTGVTRNSLVVLPLVLALPAGYGVAPLAVVTQTLVELLVMVALVRVVPALLPVTGSAPSGRS